MISDRIECLRCGRSVERTNNRQIYCKPCGRIEKAEYRAAHQAGQSAYYAYRRYMREMYGRGPWAPGRVDREDRWRVWAAARDAS